MFLDTQVLSAFECSSLRYVDSWLRIVHIADNDAGACSTAHTHEDGTCLETGAVSRTNLAFYRRLTDPKRLSRVKWPYTQPESTTLGDDASWSNRHSARSWLTLTDLNGDECLAL